MRINFSPTFAFGKKESFSSDELSIASLLSISSSSIFLKDAYSARGTFLFINGFVGNGSLSASDRGTMISSSDRRTILSSFSFSAVIGNTILSIVTEGKNTSSTFVSIGFDLLVLFVNSVSIGN